MAVIYYFSISWMLLSLAISIPHVTIIYKYIHSRPVIAQTVIDLSYADCILYHFSFNLVYATGIGLCLISDTLTLNFYLALAISVAAFVTLCNCLWTLAITGTLRFISIVKNSEEAGIQMLGPDNIAIWKIRWISVCLTLSIPFMGIIFFQSIPTFFYTIFCEETVQGPELNKQEPFNKIYFASTVIATIANGLPKVYSILLNRKHFADEQNSKFSMSLESSLAFPFLIVLLISMQVKSRIHRLLFFSPITLMFSCNVIPLIIIMKNKSMKQKLKDLFENSFSSFLSSKSKFWSTSVSPFEIIE